MAWPKSGPNYRPASGIPAMGVGKGDGWGGAPRGNAGDRHPNYTPHTPEMRANALAIRKDPVAMAERKILKEAKAERIQQLTDHLCDLGLNAEREETQMSATIASLNRLEGTPVATQKIFNTEVPFEEMVKLSLLRTTTKEADGAD